MNIKKIGGGGESWSIWGGGGGGSWQEVKSKSYTGTLYLNTYRNAVNMNSRQA